MTRQPHEWNPTDIALYGMGKMDMTDAEMQQHLPVGGLGPDAEAVAAMRAANWTPSVQYWRQKHIDARAERERLEKEVERLTVLLMVQDAAKERNGWNDAIEAAARIVDRSGHSLSEEIRALKRPTPATEASHE